MVVVMIIMTGMTLVKDEEMSAKVVDDEDWSVWRRMRTTLIISMVNSDRFKIPISFDHIVEQRRGDILHIIRFSNEIRK